jgi:hypothetical protein
MQADTLRMNRYRAVLAGISEHSHVLPVYTAPKEGITRPFLHAASFAVIDRNAWIPYLFSANVGSPMKYFRYVDRPYAPHELWYLARTKSDARLPFDSDVSPDVDWKQVAAHYQYLLVTKPYDPAYIPIANRVVSENAVAALLALQ